jgi:hypothetical protein
VLFSPSSALFLTNPSPLAKGRAAVAVRCSTGPAMSVSQHEEEGEREGSAMVGRRRALASTAAVCGASVLGFAGHGLAATQGLLAGRIPGLSEPDEYGKLFFLFSSFGFVGVVQNLEFEKEML